MQKITAQHFYEYLSCPAWVYRDRDEKKALSALERRLQVDGLLPDVKRELLKARGFDEVDEEDHDEAFANTLELMEKGVQTILHGALVHGRYVSRPDILERVEGRSRFGNYYYIACDIKRSRKVRRETMVTGVFHAEVLALVQSSRPNQGYVMDPDGIVQSFMIDEVEGKYHLTLHHLERVLAGEDPGELLSSRCKNSPWFGDCKKTAESCDGLSRINRIWEEEIERLENAGYKTVNGLAKAKLETIEKKVSSMNRDRLSFIHRQAVALVSGKHDVVEKVNLETADTELYFDIESDPLRDLEYLFGILEVKKDKLGRTRKKYYSSIAKKPGDEKIAWERFVEFMEKREGAPVYHYGWYEIEVVRRMARKYNTDQEFVEKLLSNMIDLLSIIRPAVIFPLSFYALKDLAVYAGFSWRHPELSGINSILYYEDWLAFNDHKKLQDIVDYNEDDVIATYELKKWMEKNAVSVTP